MRRANPFDPLQSLSQVDGAEMDRESSNGPEIDELEIDGEAEIEFDVEAEIEIDEDVDTGEEGDSEYGTDEIDDILQSQLLEAQQHWEESLEQLNKVLNWVLLPLVGKFIGRRMAKVIWKQVMEYLWR